MNYFEGINWLNNSHATNDNSWVVRQFRQKNGICYIHDGEFQFRFNNGPIRQIKTPAVMLYYPGPKFEYGVRDNSRSWNNRFVNFTGPRIKAFIEKGLFPIHKHDPIYPIHQPEQFCAAFDELRAYINNPYRNEDVATHKLEGVLLMLNNQEQTALKSDMYTRRIQRLCDDMQRNPSASWDFEVESKRMNLSYSHFRKIFRDHIGKSPYQVLIQFRLNRAAQLLLNTNRTLADISEYIGIKDPHYFIRSFKKHFRMSPGRYRRELA